MSGNSNLHMSRSDKADEFYTQLSLIENELRHYKDYFKGKIVFCNCDDPYESNFFKYFAMNFNVLGLKKLIATCYREGKISKYKSFYRYTETYSIRKTRWYMSYMQVAFLGYSTNGRRSHYALA